MTSLSDRGDLKSQEDLSDDYSNPSGDDELDEAELDFSPHRRAENEKELAMELQQLSLEERQEALFDIHGVSKVVEETKQVIQRCLEELDTCIENTKGGRRGSSYRMAESQSAEYVKNEKFRIKFLRTDDYNPKNAAYRIFRHFDEKLSLFGEERLCRDITIDDLDKYDMECLCDGHEQWLPLRDQTGRAVIVVLLPFVKDKFTVQNAMRAMFYSIMAASEDEDSQKKGIISIVYTLPAAESASPNPRLAWNAQSLRGAMPLFNGGFHVCVNDTLANAFAAWFIRLFNRKNRVRFRVHNGSHEECMKSLRTFGIPVLFFPVTEHGELLRDMHLEWVKTRKKVDAKHVKDSAVLLPRIQDILFGRGKGLQNHLGNVRLRLTMESYYASYESFDKKEKTKLAAQIVQEVKAKGSRFLKKTNEAWEEVPDNEARSKVSHFFRNLRSAMSKPSSHLGSRKRDSMELENENSARTTNRI